MPERPDTQKDILNEYIYLEIWIANWNAIYFVNAHFDKPQDSNTEEANGKVEVKKVEEEKKAEE